MVGQCQDPTRTHQLLLRMMLRKVPLLALLLLAGALQGCSSDSKEAEPEAASDESTELEIRVVGGKASPGGILLIEVTTRHGVCYSFTESEGDRAFDLRSDGGPTSDLGPPTWAPAGQGSCEYVAVPPSDRERVIVPDVATAGDYWLCLTVEDAADGGPCTSVQVALEPAS